MEDNIQQLINAIQDSSKKYNLKTDECIKILADEFNSHGWSNYLPGTITRICNEAKCDGINNISDLIRLHMECYEEDSHNYAIIDKVIDCNDDDIRLISSYAFVDESGDGGWHSFSDGGYLNYVTMLKGQTMCLYIDREGYDYNRYIELPEDWREMYAAEIAAVEEQKTIDEAQQLIADAQQQKIEKEDYEKRCAKYEKYMTAVEQPKSWKDRKAIATAWNVTKKNIKAMLAVDFPGVKFSVKKYYTGGVEISWTNGPTEEELRNKTDLDLFARVEYHSAGPCDDYGHYAPIKNCEFARKYTTDYHDIKTDMEFERLMSDEVRKEIHHDVAELFEFDELGELTQTEENLTKILKYTNRRHIGSRLDLRYMRKSEVANMIFEKLSLY